jgi:hypothetical protein
MQAAAKQQVRAPFTSRTVVSQLPVRVRVSFEGGTGCSDLMGCCGQLWTCPRPKARSAGANTLMVSIGHGWTRQQHPNEPSLCLGNTLSLQAPTGQRCRSLATAAAAACTQQQQPHPAGQLGAAAATAAAAPQHSVKATRSNVSCKAGQVPTVAFFGRSDPELTVVKLQV